MEKILSIIETQPMLTAAQIAAMVDRTEQEVVDIIEQCKREGIIKGYRTLIDWDKVSTNHVKALIELRVSPKKGRGFEEIAQTVASMPEVEAVTLISGGYDLLVEIKAKSFQEIAMLVAKRLSPLDDVNGTKTNFVLRPYKVSGVPFIEEDKDERGLNFL
ncbi:MAG: Lrp/AsnC family transcriptional regulator [Oscillospiraceae bacterium]|nr:Lrp/AsnC family transcriptional regulator [Oscillospiraceae bacterium]MBR6518499.1 Lrp/AsnC family transcriptional regulator [Oscillospiraceae bacterium]